MPDWPVLCADLREELRKPTVIPEFNHINQCAGSRENAQDLLNLKKDTDNKHPSSAFTSLPHELHLKKEEEKKI